MLKKRASIQAIYYTKYLDLQVYMTLYLHVDIKSSQLLLSFTQKYALAM